MPYLQTVGEDYPTSERELLFDGFAEMVQQPLEASDPISFKRIKRMFLEIPGRQTAPLRLLLLRLTGKSLREDEARQHWRRILQHKAGMEEKLGRLVGIQTAAVDYFDMLANPRGPFKPSASGSSMARETPSDVQKADGLLERIFAGGYHQERLREEMMRARRYRHALSAIMFNIDAFREVSENVSPQDRDRLLALIVRIAQKTVRTVDILARYDADRFLIILPNTNKREALELAERLRKNIAGRSRLLGKLEHPIMINAAAEQCELDETTASFLSRLENILERGRNTARDAVYSL